MSSILVGTASWTDKSLIDSGGFYPPTVKSPEERLKFYASEFPIVEVDSSYYALPVPQNAQLWAERTPEGFTFNGKAFRLFTGHQTDPKVLPKDIRAALGPRGRRSTSTTGTFPRNCGTSCGIASGKPSRRCGWQVLSLALSCNSPAWCSLNRSPRTNTGR